jgi:hypothetical protein
MSWTVEHVIGKTFSHPSTYNPPGIELRYGFPFTGLSVWHALEDPSCDDVKWFAGYCVEGNWVRWMLTENFLPVSALRGHRVHVFPVLLVFNVVIGVVVLGCIALIVDRNLRNRRLQFQYGLRTLLLLAAGVAVFLALDRELRPVAHITSWIAALSVLFAVGCCFVGMVRRVLALVRLVAPPPRLRPWQRENRR